jgi:hypothetical protein
MKNTLKIFLIYFLIPTITAFVFILFSICFNKPAQVATCGNHDQIVKALNKIHHEYRQTMALAGDGQTLIELFTKKDNSTYTIIATPKPTKTTPNPMTCIIVAGQHWINTPVQGTSL